MRQKIVTWLGKMEQIGRVSYKTQITLAGRELFEMCKPGENGSQTYAEKTKHKNIHVEEHRQPQHEMMAPQNEMAAQQEEQDTAYDRFFQVIKPLPPLPVAGGAAPQEEKPGYKERKRRKKAYEKLGKENRLLRENEVKALPQFQTKERWDKWAGETLPHSKLTREQTLKQVINDQDYSNFENLDLVMRNLVASNALLKFVREYHINENSDPDAICAQIQQNSTGVTGLLDPTLRLGLSLAQRSNDFPPEMQTFFRKLDEAMSTAVMVSTLTHVADQNAVKTYFEGKGSADADGDASKAIEANKAQQIQIAKRLLLMQISNFQKVTTVKKHRFKTDEIREENWDKSMAVALSHCSRVVLTLPKQDVFSSANAHKKMWQSILTTDGANTAQDNSRASSTHNLKRRRVNKRGRELKVLFNLIGQRGMNCAIGGLGNAGVSGKTLCNDGSCGHFYSMYKEADSNNYGAMLMGLESDANAVTNQMGHTHDWHATAEKASSLGGQRTDEVGDKYGGRQCDLSEIPANTITLWMTALENAMLYWQSQPGGMSSAEAVRAMQMISGKKLDADGLRELLTLLNNAEARLLFPHFFN